VTAHEIDVIEFVAPRVVWIVLMVVIETIAAAVLGALGVIEIGGASC